MTRMGIVMSFTLRHLGLAALALGIMSGSAHAIPAGIGRGLIDTLPSGGRLAEGVFTPAPHALDMFCATWGDQCVSSGAGAVATLDGPRWAELKAVNDRVNRKIRAKADQPGNDVWSLGVDEGDCDDYAVEKRKELTDLGWPAAALSLTVAFTQSGEGHLLLTVRTDRGDFALDNLRRSIVSVDRAGYRWVARQSPIHPRLWVRIDGFFDAPVLAAKAPVESRPAAEAAEAPIVLASAPARPVKSSGPHGRRAAPIATAPSVAEVASDEAGPCETAKAPTAFDFRSVFTFIDPTTVGTIPDKDTIVLSIEAR